MDYTKYIAHIIVIIQILGIIAAIHAILHARTAQGAIAWATSLFFMPTLTLIPYLIFGQSYFHEYVISRRKANQKMKNAVTQLEWKPWVVEVFYARQYEAYKSIEVFEKISSMPPFGNNQISLLINGQETFEAIFESINNAKKVILIQSFIIKDDSLGNKLADLLLKKNDQGVKIYLIYDQIGCHALSKKFKNKLQNNGINICSFITNRSLINRFQINFRNHRKIIVVDGLCGFIGGHNIGDEYLGKHKKLSPWRDTHIKIEGPVVTCLQESFAEDWYWMKEEIPILVLPKSYPKRDMLCQVIPFGPADQHETGSLFFTTLINKAKNILWISSPYFIPDESVFSALQLAVLRGVDVRILIPSKPDHKIVYSASILYAIEAIEKGIKIYKYQPGFLHQKVILVDDKYSGIGSANLDNRSFRLNFEIMFVTYNQQFNLKVKKMLINDFQISNEVKKENFKHHIFRKIGSKLARLFSPVL